MGGWWGEARRLEGRSRGCLLHSHCSERAVTLSGLKVVLRKSRVEVDSLVIIPEDTRLSTCAFLSPRSMKTISPAIFPLTVSLQFIELYFIPAHSADAADPRRGRRAHGVLG